MNAFISQNPIQANAAYRKLEGKTVEDARREMVKMLRMTQGELDLYLSGRS